MSDHRETTRLQPAVFSRLPNSLTMSPKVVVVPRIDLIGDTLSCEGKSLYLGRKPLTRKLFEVFIRSPNTMYSRDRLVQMIYCESPLAIRSERYRTALGQNIVKLVSRARFLADKTFNEQEKWIDWFCYDAEKAQWSFYQPTRSYLQAKEALFTRLLRQDIGVDVH